jgi:hypothetical protein
MHVGKQLIEMKLFLDDQVIFQLLLLLQTLESILKQQELLVRN